MQISIDLGVKTAFFMENNRLCSIGVIIFSNGIFHT